MEPLLVRLWKSEETAPAKRGLDLGRCPILSNPCSCRGGELSKAPGSSRQVIELRRLAARAGLAGRLHPPYCQGSPSS